MTSTTDSTVRRALASIRRRYAEMDRISRAMFDYETGRTRP